MPPVTVVQPEFVNGGPKRGSNEATERADGVGGGGGGGPPPTIRIFYFIFFLFVYENGIFLHSICHY